VKTEERAQRLADLFNHVGDRWAYCLPVDLTHRTDEEVVYLSEGWRIERDEAGVWHVRQAE